MKIAERFQKNATKVAMMLILALCMALMPLNIGIDSNNSGVGINVANAQVTFVTGGKNQKNQKKEKKNKDKDKDDKKRDASTDSGIIRLGQSDHSDEASENDGYTHLTTIDINKLWASKAYQDVAYNFNYGSENVLTFNRIRGTLSQYALQNERGCVNFLLTRVDQCMYIVVDSHRGIDMFNYGFIEYGNILIRAEADFDVLIENVDPSATFTKKEKEILAQFMRADEESIISVIKITKKIKPKELRDGKMMVTSTPEIVVNTTSKTNDLLNSISTGFSIFSQFDNWLGLLDKWGILNYKKK